MENFNIPKSDKGYSVAFTVTDSADAAYDLTGYTVTLKTWSPGVSGTIVVTGTCTITDAAGGLCSYALTGTDFTTVGRWMAELELTKTGHIESTEPFSITVTESG